MRNPDSFSISFERHRVIARNSAGQIVGHLEFADDPPGANFITEISSVIRRRGVATIMLDALRKRYPRASVCASDRETNTAEGNAFFDAYNARAGQLIVELLGD
jgi:hypothetical protein